MGDLLKIANCDNPNRIADVIFVHGLDGDAKTTWHLKDKPEDFWPTWLGQDFPNVGIWSLGYAASASAWKGHSMPLYDRAHNTLDRMQLDGIGQRPIGFVCHSLGGLLTKQVLKNAKDSTNPAWQDIATQTRFIMFLSTPHSGADMADWVQYIGGLLRITDTVEELKAHHPQLRQLNIWYRNHVAELGIETFVYCEKLKMGGILVVNETTADPGIPGVTPIPLDENHISICKPASKDSHVYLRVERLIKTTLTLIPKIIEKDGYYEIHCSEGIGKLLKHLPELRPNQSEEALRNIKSFKAIHSLTEKLFCRYRDYQSLLIKCQVAVEYKDLRQQYDQYKETAQRLIDDMKSDFDDFRNGLDCLPDNIAINDVRESLKGIPLCREPFLRTLGMDPKENRFMENFALAFKVSKCVEEILLEAQRLADRMLERYFSKIA